MINIKKTEPKIQNGKKVINIKNAFLDENNVLCDESGNIFEQLKPELPPNLSINFKISFELQDGDDVEDNYSSGYNDLVLD